MNLGSVLAPVKIASHVQLKSCNNKKLIFLWWTGARLSQRRVVTLSLVFVLFFATVSHRCFTITTSPSEGIVSAAVYGWRTATDSCSHKSHISNWNLCCKVNIHRHNIEKVNACIMSWIFKSSLCVESAFKKLCVLTSSNWVSIKTTKLMFKRCKILWIFFLLVLKVLKTLQKKYIASFLS